MIGKKNSELSCTCDECGETEWAGTQEFTAFWEGLKADGWRARKDGDEWTHTCPECEEG